MSPHQITSAPPKHTRHFSKRWIPTRSICHLMQMKWCTQKWDSSFYLVGQKTWLDYGPCRTGLMTRGLDVLLWRTSEPQYRLGADTEPLMAAPLISVNIEFIFCCVSVQTCAPSRPLRKHRAALSRLPFLFPVFPPSEKCFAGRNSNLLGITRPLHHGVTAAAAALQQQNRKTNTRQGPLFSLLVIRSSSSSNEAWRLNKPLLKVDEASFPAQFPPTKRLSWARARGFVVDLTGLWHGVRRAWVIEVQEDADECGPAGVRSCKHV